jgi:hypothetical protein
MWDCEMYLSRWNLMDFMNSQEGVIPRKQIAVRVQACVDGQSKLLALGARYKPLPLVGTSKELNGLELMLNWVPLVK